MSKLMGKYIVSLVIGAGLFISTANAEDLAGMKGLEGIGSGSSQHSPSQVVILNHVPSQSQDQRTESLNSSTQRARAGWGTGESLKALRDSRINKEAKNEQVLMEKLEVSRMEDEKSRLKRLFKIRSYNRRRHMEMGEGDSEFGYAESDYASEYAEVPYKKTERVVNIVSAPTVALNGVDPEAPVMASRSGSSTFSAFRGYSSEKPLYIKGQLGLGKYSASNTSTPIGTASWGLSVGKNINNRWLLEVGVYKTSYQVNDPNAVVAEVYSPGTYSTYYSQERTLKQYNFSGLLGFKLIKAKGFMTSLRGGFSYVRRSSDSSDVTGLQPFKSNTIDGLVGVGVDVKIAKNLMLAGSFDYYSNLLNDIASTNAQVVERVETANYYVLGLGLKLNF